MFVVIVGMILGNSGSSCHFVRHSCVIAYYLLFDAKEFQLTQRLIHQERALFFQHHSIMADIGAFLRIKYESFRFVALFPFSDYHGQTHAWPLRVMRWCHARHSAGRYQFQLRVPRIFVSVIKKPAATR